MLCTCCDGEVLPSNPPVWSDKADMFICTLCAMDEDADDEEWGDDDDD